MSFPLAIVTSRFNEAVTKGLQEGALARLEELNFKQQDIQSFTVPGAVEIPLTLQALAKTGRYKALVALGAVIRGETGHYDFVCQQVSQGCQRVSLDYAIPVGFGVLTCDTAEQAFARAGGSHSNKGREAIDAACEMVLLLKELA